MKKLVGLFLAALMIVLLIPVTSKADEIMLLPDSGEYDNAGANIDDFVSFKFNGGRLVYQGREYLIDARFPYYSDRGPVNLPTSISREGYEFDGWYESDDFTGEPLVTIPQGYHGSIYVWAKWNKIQREDEKTQESESETSDNPLTGDNNTTGLFLLLMIVSLCTIGVATISVKRK